MRVGGSPEAENNPQPEEQTHSARQRHRQRQSRPRAHGASRHGRGDGGPTSSAERARTERLDFVGGGRSLPGEPSDTDVADTTTGGRPGSTVERPTRMRRKR